MKSIKKKVFHNFSRFYFLSVYFVYIVLFIVYTYPVGIHHKTKGGKLNTKTDIKAKLP